MEYVLSEKKKAGLLNDSSYTVMSIVSTHLARSIAARHNVKLYETLTGIKNIAATIRKHTDHANENFTFGFEESNGYMINTNVRDKDGVIAAVAIAEIAALSKSKGIDLVEQLESIHDLYGFAAEKNICIEGKGIGDKYMSHLRELNGRLGEPGTELGWIHVKKFTDFMPESNVLLYEIGDLDWIAFRPSGTEPKFKIYFGFYGTESASDSRLERISKAVLLEVEKYKEN